jgi:hypothetical protein
MFNSCLFDDPPPSSKSATIIQDFLELV